MMQTWSTIQWYYVLFLIEFELFLPYIFADKQWYHKESHLTINCFSVLPSLSVPSCSCKAQIFILVKKEIISANTKTIEQNDCSRWYQTLFKMYLKSYIERVANVREDRSLFLIHCHFSCLKGSTAKLLYL